MNQTNRDKVLDYLNENETAPLYYDGYESPKNEFNPNKFTVKEMVLRAMALCCDYDSYNSDTKEYETCEGKHRSAIDLWRHIKYYYPEIEIFDVIMAIKEICNVDFKARGQFCNDVKRRVFWLGNFNERTTDFNTPDQMRFYTNSRTTDEFGLEWDDWKDI